MKKIALVLLMSLFVFACTKNNDVIPDPDPTPNPTVYKTSITVTFNVPDNVILQGGSDMWILDMNKDQITNRIPTQFPTKTIVLTGDTIKANLNKVAYIECHFSKRIGWDNYEYRLRKSFIMEPVVNLTFSVSPDRESEYYIDP